MPPLYRTRFQSNAGRNWRAVTGRSPHAPGLASAIAPDARQPDMFQNMLNIAGPVHGADGSSAKLLSSRSLRI